ncbi:187-kDa microtubule-associated protein AIR9-like isoform X1 [Papaver somniferum]|uniref:187-kDa microtubule-associated protein AIR9-like isoform X1 n=1 Tax=Papaver somniferum TaxID=3469 RepID=UPI000E6F6721|nr:187-kDa microtubule-associated protein AIR9-like isoform X1 [Papaver somniferum]
MEVVEAVNVDSVEDLVKKPEATMKSSVGTTSSAESGVKRSIKAAGVPSRVLASTTSSRKKIEGTNLPGSTTNLVRTTVTRSSLSPVTAPPVRRNSTGGLTSKQPVTHRKPADSAAAAMPVPGRRTTPAASDPTKSASSEPRRASFPSVLNKSVNKPSVSDAKRSSPVSSVSSRGLRTSPGSDTSKQDSVRKPSVRSSTSAASSIKRGPSLSLDTSVNSSSNSTLRKSVTKLSSPSSRSPSVNSGKSAADRGSSLSGRKKASTPESRDSRFIVLPQVEIKAGDDLRLDLRGHRVRSLNSSGLNLSSNLEFVYLRDNLLSSLEGIEILKRVKVLDLSFNEFKGPGFEQLENCKALQQLYLAGNQITSLVSLPQLPNLEFLSVAQNRLKSLSMASQPRLQVLAASKNKISTLKGFPHLPVLEHLRVEENPILEMPHLEAASILLVGPTLKKFNDRDLSRDELEIAKRYPAHTALCIRDGWEFCRPDLVVDSTFRFLVEQWKDQMPPGYLLKQASVDPPFEEDICRCHFVFAKDRSLTNDSELSLKYQWLVGEKTPTNFLPIANGNGEVYWPKREDIDKFLKVECTPTLNDIEYPSIFAISSPVSSGTGYPKVLNLSVQGELVEGNVIKGHPEVAWCGGTPGKGVASWLRRRWNSSPVVIVGAEDEEYRLTTDDIDSSLVFMYTPVTEEGAKGEPQYAMTDFIKAATPSVSNVEILGEFVEGNTIKGVGEYFGGREGPSKFEWLRENKETGDFVLVSTGTPEYNLTKDDVGRRLKFVYIPTNFEGQEGESASFSTQIVKQAPPRVTNLKIVGDLREGNKVTVTAIVTGGTEGSSRVQWFKTSSSKLEGEDDLEILSASKIAKAFRIPLGAVGHYIVAKFTPMAPDGESGQPAYLISEKAVETLPPSLNFLSVTGDYAEGSILTASYGYIGGHEGKSVYNWYLHETENGAGSLVQSASGHLQYRITKDAIGKFVSFKCSPVRDDGIFGEPRTTMAHERVRPGSPKLLSLEILGKSIEGTTLQVEKQYWGGEEGDSVFRWFLTDSDGTQSEIKGATGASYFLTNEDIGYLISVSCEPIRSDLARGATVLSEQIGPVVPGPPTCQSLEFSGPLMEGKRLGYIATYTGGEQGSCSHEWFRISSDGTRDKLSNDAEYLDLTAEDVGRCIELIYTPVRKDGIKGTPKLVKSDEIAPADPMGVELVIPVCCQDTLVVPQKSYYGGKEGNSDYTWYRTYKKLQESDGIDSEDVFICGKSLTYTPVLEDVGAYLALNWVPTRMDGKTGEPLVAVSSNPVAPASPVVSNVRVKELSYGLYSGEGEYYGGYEGSSVFNWYRETNDGTIVLINEADSTTYEVTDSDYTCRLLFGYTPVRSDKVAGELKLSEPTDIILPELLRIQMLSLTGKAVEGEKLTAVEIIPETDIQKHVWDKYKKAITYEWFFSTEDGDNKSFLPLASHRSSSFKLRFEDIGRSLRCVCVVTDMFGRSSESAAAETTPVLPGIPKIDKLEIEGRGFHTNLYAVRGIYHGGREGKSRIQWLRSMVGSPDLISIPGEVERMYEANVDDVGYRLVAIYTPIREDGVEGQPVSASTDPILVEPDVLKEVKQKLELGTVKFEVLCDKDRTPRKPQVPGQGSLERRNLEVNRKRVKVVKPSTKTSFATTEIRGTYTPPFHVELFRNDQHRMRIVVDSENEVDLMVQSRHIRDIIVLVIRGLAQRFNSTSLNSLLKIET